jgi:hypothetical protein
MATLTVGVGQSIQTAIGAIVYRMRSIPLPSADYLRECFSYDPETGVLMWKERPRGHFASERGWRQTNGHKAGNSAGHLDTAGYLTVEINDRGCKVARIIWKLQTGLDPVAEIDHINHDRADNRWSNLREATHHQNTTYRRWAKRELPRGVYLTREGRYASYVQSGNRRLAYLGTYATPDEARAAWLAYVQPRRGEFFCDGES